MKQRWLSRRGFASLWLQGLTVLVLVLWGAGAWAQKGKAGFDHTKTGFALSGQHTAARCESCHARGIFKGTPKDCASCHTSGARLAQNNLVMPARHIPTTETCDTCHTAQSFAGAKFSHATVVAGTCATCHNGASASGKTRDHLTTQASCDTCHRTTAWLPATKFDHAGVAPGTCASCHKDSLRGTDEGGIGPNLVDNVWIHGNKPTDLLKVVNEGVLAKGMPAWEPVLGQKKTAEVVAYVLSHHKKGASLFFIDGQRVNQYYSPISRPSWTEDPSW